MLGDVDGWRSGLAEAGVEILADTAASRADLVVTPAARAREAVRYGVPMIVIEGRLPRSLRDSGLDVEQLLARPDAAAPALLLPLAQRRAAAYAVANWSIVDSRWKLARRSLAYRLVRTGLWPPVGAIVTVCHRDAALPAIIEASRPLGLPEELEWVLTLGQGDVLSRNVFHLFRRERDEPDWVLKFARVPDYSEPFDRDERGLALAAAAGGVAAARAPRLVGRFTWNGIHASVETAGRGGRLRELLTSPLPNAEKRRSIDALCTWIVQTGAETAAAPAALEPERARLLDQVIPQWTRNGATSELVDGLPHLAPVLQHNDLGSWNVLVHDGDFTVVDWESARRHGLPLWDLFYFLADALALLDGEVAGATRHLHTIALFRGEAPSSETLFRWTRAGANALAIAPDAVARLATLCWLHHSLSHVHRRDSLTQLTSADESRIHGTELVASAWLDDPSLAAGWEAWRH